jgi:hypothetical protein
MVLLNDLGKVTHMNILVLGDKHTGKSSLISTFVNPKNAITCEKDSYSPTIEDSILLQYIVNTNRNDSNYNTSSLFLVSNQTESLQEVLNNQTIPKDSVLDLESILSEISSNMDGSSCDFSVDTLNEVSLDDLSVSQSLFMEHPEKEKMEHSQTINLTITEIGGAEEFSSLIPSAIEKADAFMLVYDVGNEESFHHIWNYFRKIVEIKMERPKDIPMILVGSMVDTIVKRITSSRNREVTTEQGRLFANLTSIPFFESSAKAPKVVSSCFKKLISESQRIYMDYFENYYIKQRIQQLQQGELNEYALQNGYPIPSTSEESAKTYTSMKRSSLYKGGLRSSNGNTNIISNKMNNNSTNGGDNNITKFNTTNNSSTVSTKNNSNQAVSIPIRSVHTSLSTQQQLLISSLQPQPVVLPTKYSSSNSVESSLSSNSTLINNNNTINNNNNVNDNNTINNNNSDSNVKNDIMNNNNNSGNTLHNENENIIEKAMPNSEADLHNNISNKRNSILYNLLNNNNNNNNNNSHSNNSNNDNTCSINVNSDNTDNTDNSKIYSDTSNHLDDENKKIETLLNSPSQNLLKPLSNPNHINKPLSSVSSINSRSNSFSSNSNSNSSSNSSNNYNINNNFLPTGIMNETQQSIHSSLDRKNYGSGYQFSPSPTQRNFTYNDQVMYLPQSVSNTLNRNNIQTANNNNLYTNSAMINEKRLSKNSISDTTTANLISALSAMTLGDSNSVSSQTKTETLTFLKNFIASQENELALSSSTGQGQVNENENDPQKLINNIEKADSLLNIMNNHSLISLVSKSNSDNCANLNKKQNFHVNKKHFSDNSSILSNQIRHISSLSDLELLKDKNLSQEQLLKEIYSSDNSPLKELKKLQNQIEEEEINPVNSNPSTTINAITKMLPLSPALSDATISTHTSTSSLSSSSNNGGTLNRKRNSKLYNNMLNLKQQHYLQQNNLLVKPTYHHNLSNIIEDTEINKVIPTNNIGITNNSYITPQGINLSVNDTSNYNYQNNPNLLVQQQQQQQQRHYLKSSISTPNMHLNNNHLCTTLNNNSLNISNNFDITNASVNPTMSPSLNRMNQSSLNTTITNDDLINNYEQLLNLYNVQIKKLQLQLLQQQKQIELTTMADNSLMGQDSLNLLSNIPTNPITNNTQTPNLYNTVDPSLYTASLGNNTLNHNGYTYNNNNKNNINDTINNNLGVSPSLGLNSSYTNNTNPTLNSTNATTMNNNNLLNLNSHHASISPQSSTNTNINVNGLNYIPSSNINYLQNFSLNYPNGTVNVNSSNYYNNGQVTTTNSNGLNLTSLHNNLSTTTNGLEVTSPPLPNTLDKNEIYQKRQSLTMNQFNNNLPSSENFNTITNINLNPTLNNITTSNTIPDSNEAIIMKSNDQSINNAKNLFLEVIKDFNENDIQDIVQGSGVTMDFNKRL